MGDYREQIVPNLDAVRPKAPVVKISKPHEMSDYELDKLYNEVVNKPGPASHNPDFKLTEKRTDIGVQKFRKPDPKDKQDEVDDRSALFPNHNAVLPNHMTFKYYEPSDVKPQHTPEKVKNPGRWKYYDIDLDVVRE